MRYRLEVWAVGVNLKNGKESVRVFDCERQAMEFARSLDASRTADGKIHVWEM